MSFQKKGRLKIFIHAHGNESKVYCENIPDLEKESRLRKVVIKEI